MAKGKRRGVGGKRGNYFPGVNTVSESPDGSDGVAHNFFFVYCFILLKIKTQIYIFDYF